MTGQAAVGSLPGQVSWGNARTLVGMRELPSSTWVKCDGSTRVGAVESAPETLGQIVRVFEVNFERDCVDFAFRLKSHKRPVVLVEPLPHVYERFGEVRPTNLHFNDPHGRSNEAVLRRNIEPLG